MQLNRDNQADLLTGSLFFGTGGGLPYAEHAQLLSSVLEVASEVPVTPLSEFNDKNYIVSAYGVGDPAHIQEGFGGIVADGLSHYTRLTGIDVQGIIAGELGAEGLSFAAAGHAGVPLADADLVGGRAAPEIQMDAFTVKDLSLTPILGVSTNGKRILLEGSFSAVETETTLRRFFQENEGSGLLIGYPLTAEQYRNTVITDTISRAMEVGRLLNKGEVGAALDVAGGEIIDTGTLVNTSISSGGDFLQGWLSLEEYEVWVKNEHILLLANGNPKVEAPDLLVLLAPDGKPIHNSDIHHYEGEEVTIVSIPATGYWQEPEHRILWTSAFPENHQPTYAHSSYRT